ncbi:MAG: murein biosynthesis integral membrane protein MurJ [Turicibacter sp.]|nr:murein biosynthesis integral membrane protein MurJ [Turicibacter sp.]
MNFVIIMLIVLTFVSRIMGLGREIALAYFYGISDISDAYLMSIAIPTIIVTFVIVSLATSYVPAYQNLEEDAVTKKAFTNKVMGLTCTICLLILVVSYFFMPQIAPLFVSGFDAPTMALTVVLTRITIFAVFFMGMNQILQSFMQVKEKVLLASLSGLPFNIIAILFIVVSVHTSVEMLAIGTVIALGIQCLYLLILAHRQGFKLKPQFDLKDATIRNLIVLTLPIILSNTALQIGIMIDKNLASRFGAGAISALAYATRTTTAISGIFVTSILVVTFPKIAKQSAVGDMPQLKDSLAESIVGMGLFIIPVIAAVLLFAQPVITLLFGRGAFDTEAILLTSSLLFFYIFFLFGDGMTQLLSRVFFSLGDSKTPMIVSVVTVVINVVLNFVFIALIGIIGLALATSVSAMIGLALLFVLLRRKIGSLRLRDTVISLNKIVGASVLMAYGAYFVYQYLEDFNATLALLVAAVFGIGIYGVLLVFLRIREVNNLLAIAISKIRNRWKKT